MFRFLTAGESHGPGLTVIVEGLPAGLEVSKEYLSRDMTRRMQGHGRGGRMKIETDEPIIRSGIRHGLTLGSPISILIDNRDFANGNGPDGTPWQQAMSIGPSENPGAPITHLRPGHADTPGIVKYLQEDARNILERSSARESAARVAAGSLAKRFLEAFGIEVHGHVQAIGGIHAPSSTEIDWNAVETSVVRCSDSETSNRMVEAIDNARDAGDSLGGVVEVLATGLPIGLGSHIQWDRKLTTRLAGAVMSMNAVKGVEFGAGFSQADLPGSSVHDVIKPVSDWTTEGVQAWEQPYQRRTNNSGGLEGGMTTGEPLVVRAAVKPIATIINGLPTVDLRDGKFVDRAHFERSDITFVPTCSVIAEAMVSIVLADAMLEKFGGDHISETKRNFDTYRQGYADIRNQQEI
jgi:chorismate synthase